MNKVDRAFISVHSKTGTLEIKRPDIELYAHAFGPFAGLAELEAFELERPDDCFKAILQLFVPPGSVIVGIDPVLDRAR